MRCVASVGLFALGLPALFGCNQIFGIDQTVAYDAPTDVVADRTFVKLDWQLSTSDAAPALVPISPMPAVRIATLGDASALGAWMTPPTTEASYATDGAIDIPRAFLDAPWRLEYKLADGIPHEVQWQPVDKMGQLTVPLFGRLQRDMLPAGSGYTVAPSGAPPSMMSSSRLFTTGLWTEGPMASPANFDATALSSLSGGLGAIDQDKGDRAVYVAYFKNAAMCRYATGSVVLPSATLIEGGHTSSSPAWDTNSASPVLPLVPNGAVTRLTMLGDLVDGVASGALMYGAMPNSQMPGLAATAAASAAENVPLPIPVMVTLSN